jgi:hypothetical protein
LSIFVQDLKIARSAVTRFGLDRHCRRNFSVPPNQVFESVDLLPPGVSGNPQKILVPGYALARSASFAAIWRRFFGIVIDFSTP